MMRILLWDLDGTLAFWTNPVAVTFSLAYCWLGHFRTTGAGTAPSGNRARNSALHTVLAGAKGLRKVLGNRGPFSNDELFDRIVAAALGWKREEVAAANASFTRDARQGEIQGHFIRAIPPAVELVGRIASEGRYRQVVATNPVLPSALNRERLVRAGYRAEWFEFVSGAEFFVGQKSDAGFFRELLNILGANPEDCLMIGDHPLRDGLAREAGIPVFLLRTPWTKAVPVVPGLEPAASGDYAALEKRLMSTKEAGG